MDTIPISAQRKLEIDDGQGNEEKGQRRQMLASPARVVTDSRRLRPVDPDTAFPVGAVSAKMF